MLLTLSESNPTIMSGKRIDEPEFVYVGYTNNAMLLY